MTYDSWKTTPDNFFDDPDTPEECDGCGAPGVKLAHCRDPRKPQGEWLCRECVGADEPRDPRADDAWPMAENE